MAQVDRLVPMAFVADVPRSVAFYARLGLALRSSHEHEARTVWAMVGDGKAELMLSLASHPVDPDAQAVLFYLYVADVRALQAELREGGLETGEITHPFYMPAGQLRRVDPVVYVLLVGQLE